MKPAAILTRPLKRLMARLRRRLPFVTRATLRRQLADLRRTHRHEMAALTKRHAGSLWAKEKEARRAASLQKQSLVRAIRLEAEFEKVGWHRYDSFTRGDLEWERRWDESPGRRVLYYAFADYSGSFYKWAEAMNRHSSYAVRLVVLNFHQYGYRTDLVLPHPTVMDKLGFGTLLDEADIIHMKDESGFFTGKTRLPADFLTRHGKPVVYTAYGGYMRKLADDTKFRDYVSAFPARVSMTPDLNVDWFGSKYIPHAIDTDLYQVEWADGTLLCHSPSTQERKGTEDLLAAIEGLPIQFDLVHGVSHRECMARKRKASLFFDQAGREVNDRLGIESVIGWYGNSAIEAAVFGIPTIAHLSAEAFEGARRAGRDIETSCAIVNTPLGVAGIRGTIESYFRLSPAERSALSRRTRTWVEEFTAIAPAHTS